MCRGSRKSRRLQPTGSSASFVRRRCDCLASSAPFRNIQTYLLTYLLTGNTSVDDELSLWDTFLEVYQPDWLWKQGNLVYCGFGIDLLGKLCEINCHK